MATARFDLGDEAFEVLDAFLNPASPLPATPRIWRKSETVTATIAVGAASTGPVDARGYAGGGYILPSTFDGTALTFTVCDTEGGTYQTLYDQYGGALSVTVAASRSYPLPQELFGWPYFKFVAGTSQSTTDTDITVILAG